MDFNPLDLLAAAALGDKDATPELKTSEADQPVSSGQIQCASSPSEAENDKKADNEKEPEMGKSGSISLKGSHKSDKSGDTTMAPQKTPWSPDSLLSLSPEDHSVHTNVFSIDELVKDIKTKGIDMELKNIMGRSFPDNNCLNHNLVDNSHDVNFENKQNENIVAAKNEINSSSCKDKSKIALTLTSDEQRTGENDTYSTSVDDKSVDSGGEFSPASDSCQCESWALDHSYAMVEGHSTFNSPRDIDDIDVCSDLSPSTEDMEQRSQNMALDCNYLKSGIMQGASASTLDLYGVACSLGRSKLPSSSSSASSPTADVGSKSSKFMLDKNENRDYFSEPPVSSSNSSSVSPNKAASKFGKFKIGTFASFSSSNLELEKYLKNQDPKGKSHSKLNIGIPSEPHAVEQTLGSASLQPLLQSPSLDWDRSEAGSETQEDSSDDRTPSRLSPVLCLEKVTEWSHPLFHDHDYCSKDVQSAKTENVKKATTSKRKYTKRKSKLDLLNHEKIMKAKYLKKELLKQDSFLKKSVEPDVVAHEDNLKSNPVGRPRKKTVDKVVEEEIDPETGTKMKITGKFQDQYVYYLSKSSRTTTRRRQTTTLPIFQDKIIVPAPKPGDIVVHHLTDSDIETVRQKGRSALNLPERPHHTHNLPTSTSTSLPTAPPAFSSQSNDTISDVDIVSTILSMENDNLSSPTSHAPPTDLSSTVGMNLHQPALADSLRQLSGDSTFSSEHVLNYLISVVKEEQLLDGGNGFDTSSSALFPSIPPDAIYSKADNSDFGSGNFGQVPVNKNHHSESNPLQGPYQYAQTPLKNQMDGVDLPDDFPSLIPNSVESSLGSSQHDAYSNNSLKNMFGSDVGALESHQLSSPVPRLTSIEKTLDYLGVKDGEIKLDSSDYSNPFGASLSINEGSISTCQPDQQIDETPWIVTVTLYFNDVPAIMVNSEPFIRLVDIHKQILPAKDTGILKKRCQLLNIPVLNCNEMQRYFLVQYGRAYNSKSTLIVSKEQATKLVTYYATPQPRVGKVEDPSQQRPSSGNTDSKTTLPVSCPQSGVLKRKGLHKAIKKTNGLCGGSSTGVCDTSNVGLEAKPPKDETEAGQNKRTRHKKVNYLEMLKGEEKISSEDSILETIEAVVRSAPDYIRAEKSRSKKKKSKKSRKDDEKRVKGSKAKSSSKKKREKKSHKHGHKERHSSTGKHFSTKLVPTDQTIVKPVLSEGNSESNAELSHKKFKPLKLKVNSLLNFAGNKRPAVSSPSSSPAKKAGLFSRSNSVVSSSSSITSPLPPTPESVQPLTKPAATQQLCPRILAVAHQPASALPSGESRLPSQPGDIHMDLFTRPSSACVQCRTCSQFLSVPHFMRHHHVPMDNQWLASEAAHRILVPLASSEAGGKVGMSEGERRLWEEFHRLQEAIGGFGEGDDESDSDVDFTEDDEMEEEEHEHEVEANKAKQNESLQSSLGVQSRVILQSGSEESRRSGGIDNALNKSSDSTKLSQTFSRGDVSLLLKKKPQPSEASLAKIGLVRREPFENGVLHARSHIVPPRETLVEQAHVRHSSRRRKSKQFFSIENYDTVPQRPLEDCDVHNSAPYG